MLPVYFHNNVDNEEDVYIDANEEDALLLLSSTHDVVFIKMLLYIILLLLLYMFIITNSVIKCPIINEIILTEL